MSKNYVKFIGIAQFAIGLVVLGATLPQLILSFMGQASVVIMGLDMKVLFGILALLALGMAANGYALYSYDMKK